MVGTKKEYFSFFIPSGVMAALVGLVASLYVVFGVSAAGWSEVSREQRPWAYWWWMGSAVDKANLTKELTRYAEAGYGGVHIIPIYGAKGWESNYIRYLSPKWMEMLDYTVREARRLDLGVDMTTGTGWCFGGGPYVSDREGNANVVWNTFEVAGGARLTEKFDTTTIQALIAFSKEGAALEITDRFAADGSVNWVAPEGKWKVYAISQKPSPQKVKRAAPGGEGPMLNLIYGDAMPVFLRSFSEAFAKYRGLKPRAQYHDSYEYKSDWSPDFFRQFEKRRGYRLQSELPALFEQDNERSARVLADYRETVSDIIVEDSLPQWVQWSHQRGFITRNEAHGSPGNLLDLYALADVPETEMFRLDRNKLISKFASSAAHVAGRRLVGAETGTWLKEHFTETLADMKYLVDDLFLSGVNHVFYHGTCYSPDEAGWPGWVFYASYEMNPRNAVWHDVRALNDYIARSQSILQSGKSDNDVLLYWPIHDFWQKTDPKPMLPHLTVHARAWFESQPLGHLAEQLWQRGYAFDYVSDRQLAGATTAGGQIKLPGGNYRVVVVPNCEFMPLATLEKLVALADAGATVIFAGDLPKDVPGLAFLESRRRRMETLRAQVTSKRTGKIVVGNWERSLIQSKVARETLVDHNGLYFIRRSDGDGKIYFIANRSEKVVNGWIPLATTAQSVVLMDPLTGATGVGAMRSSAHGLEVFLNLEPGASMIVKASLRNVRGEPWTYWKTDGQPTELRGNWRVQFVSGGPTLPAAFTSKTLDSWTKAGNETENFSGTARYGVTFNVASSAGRSAWLDLGAVVQSARVWVNGRSYGTLLIPPYRVRVDNLKVGDNRLEVEVTSTSANAIRYYDRENVSWRNFHDINFVNQDYKPFNAATWPVAPSGLLGPVTLTPAQTVNPREETR